MVALNVESFSETLPDLSAVQHSGDDDQPVVAKVIYEVVGASG